MKGITKFFLVSFFLLNLMVLAVPSALAKNVDKPRTGEITPRSVVAGALSFFVWPGIGQAVNDNKGEKVITHAVLGLTGVYRFWSAYDAVVDRQGGYWQGRI